MLIFEFIMLIFESIIATLFNTTYVILFILPIFIWYFFYKKYLNKLWIKEKLSNWKILTKIIITNFVAWFAHFLWLLILTYINSKLM